MRKETKIKLADGSIALVVDQDNIKVLRSPRYNFFFNRSNGMFVRWGNSNKELPSDYRVSSFEAKLYKIWSTIYGADVVGGFIPFVQNLQDDGDDMVFLPNIADIEISTKCIGVSINGTMPSPCKMCYKSNTNNGKYMSTDDFAKIIDKLSPTCAQVALGIGNIDQPNLFDIMDVCINKNVVPNITINGYGMTDDLYDKLSTRCGAISVSFYDKDLCFNTIHELATVRGMSQVNIHAYIADETYESVLQLIDDLQKDDRVKNMNALVLLQAKIKGNAKINNHKQLSQEKFNILSQKLLKSGITYGSDSCGAFKTLESFKNEPNVKELEDSVISCESTIESCYINVDGDYFPCSFSEGVDSNGLNWKTGLSVLKCDNFFEDIWFNERTRQFSKSVLECRKCKKSCPIYEI